MFNHGARMLLHFVIDDRRQPLLEKLNHLNVCRNTTWSYLHEMDFRSCIAPKNSPILMTSIMQTSLHLPKLMKIGILRSWCTVIWSNELAFELKFKFI